MKTITRMFAVAGLAAISVGTLQAQYYLAGDFQTPTQWQNNSNSMTAGPGAGEYSYTITNMTPGTFGYCKVTDGTWTSTWPADNLKVRYDSTGSATVHFFPGNINDGWLPLGNRVGYDDPDNDPGWGIAGDFNGFTGTANLLPSLGSGVYSNTVTVATASTSGFKFQSPAGSWNDIFFGSDFGNGGANGSYTTTNSPQDVPVVLDLPNGRYLIGGLAPAPVTNTVVFAVDMTYQTQLGYFTPGSGVFVAGAFNGWPGAQTPQATNALYLTNSPTFSNGNTNIYWGTNVFIGLPNTVFTAYKFTQNDPLAQNGGWETSGDRQLTLLGTNGTLVLPAAVFSDLYGSDVLPVPVTLVFTISMTNAVAYTNGTTYTDAHVFDPTSDSVIINGNFLSGGWSAWDPISTSGQIMFNNPVGSEVYEYDYTVPAGSPLEFQYKFGMNYAGIANNLDNEAGFGVNHDRVVRITAPGTYQFPLDTWQHGFTEPNFGQLTAGKPSAGNVPVSWLGRPGVQLQTASSLTGTWTDIVETDGTNWIAGYASTNGFVSQTNWPAPGGSAYFRLHLH